jgi:xanthine phosphoribosyltransferase
VKALNEEIRTYGRGIGQDIVKVDMFLNHRIDTGLLFQMGEELAEHFRRQRPTMILTVESSGIALAIAAARALDDIPVVFAKKAAASNQASDQMATALVHSFTHNNDNLIRVDKRYIPIGSRVLIIDDFLANGNAVRGMTQIVEELGAKVVGVGIGVEKGFQSGGQELRESGIDLMSLAVVKEIRDGSIILEDD